MIKRFVVVGVVSAAMLMGHPTDSTATVLVNGSSNGLSASASFTISGDTLTILLTNTDTSPKNGSWGRSEILTGVFFNLGSANDVFTPLSASIAPGSLAQGAQCDVGPCGSSTTNVGGEWSYAFGGVNDSDLVGANRGISSAAYLNGGGFNGANLDQRAGVNGINFGIAGKTFTDGSGNGGLDKEPLVKGSTSFVLKIPKGLTEDMISNVYFTYGTNLDKPSFTTSTTGPGRGLGEVPEPTAVALVAAGVALASYRMRRARRARS